MQRPALVYALASSTLLAAFLLKPKERPVSPQPAPVVRVAPSTQLVYADPTLRVQAQLDRSFLTQGAQNDFWMDLSVKAVDADKRAPLTAILVIDRSGSMAGQKIAAARMAAKRFIWRLRDADEMAIVSYGTDVTVDVPLSAATGSHKRAAQRAVDVIEEGGGTNVDGALKAASRLIAQASQRGRSARVILISDGRPTEGERRNVRLTAYASELTQRGVSLSTIGVGLDYNEDLMEQLATVGHGRYHYLKQASQLSGILSKELKHATNVVAANVLLQIEAPKGFRLQAVPGRVLDGQQVGLGDLASGEERHVLAHFVSTGAVTSTPRFFAPRVSYQAVGASAATTLEDRTYPFVLGLSKDAAQVTASLDRGVQAKVARANAGLVLRASMQDFGNGRVQQAIARLQSNRAALEQLADDTGDAELKREAQNIGFAMDQLRDVSPSSSTGLEMQKAQKARAFELLY